MTHLKDFASSSKNQSFLQEEGKKKTQHC